MLISCLSLEKRRNACNIDFDFVFLSKNMETYGRKENRFE